MAAVAAVMLLLTWRLDNSRLGLKLLAIREDESAAESLGIPTTRLKIGTFVASAIAPAAMGSLYAVYLGFIDPPTAFASNIELTTIAMVLLGGMGTVLGPLVGALVLSVVNEVLWANYPQIYLACVGVIVLLAVLFMPRGIVNLGMKSGWLGDRTAAVSPARPRDAGRGDVMSETDPRRRERVQALCRPHRARFRQHRRRAGIDHRRDRPQRFRQIDAVQHHRRHAAPRRRAACWSTGATSPRRRPREICGLGVARTFQISRLFAEMTVLENLVAVARGRDDRAAIALALELLDFLEITDIADRWGSELSYGQRKLVEIARALMLQPKIMLLDEPFAGINPRLQNRIVEHLQTLCARGITVFFIDHEMRIVLKECDLVYVLAEGQLIARGDPQTVRNDAKVLEAYF